MKGALLFFLGLVAGVISTLFVLFLFSLGSIHNNQNNISNVQYVDIEGKNGIVKLHTGMSKDSVYILVGKPNEVDLMTIGNQTNETWRYQMNNKYRPELRVDFIDGKLTGIKENKD